MKKVSTPSTSLKKQHLKTHFQFKEETYIDTYVLYCLKRLIYVFLKLDAAPEQKLLPIKNFNQQRLGNRHKLNSEKWLLLSKFFKNIFNLKMF